MIYKLTRKHFNIFCNECRQFQQIWGINGWDITFEHKKLEVGDYAQVVTDYEQHAVLVTLAREWDKEPNNDELKNTAKHEMIHVLMGKMRGVALSRFISEDELKATEHDTVNILCKIL